MTKEEFNEAKTFFKNLAEVLDLQGNIKLIKAMTIAVDTFVITRNLMEKEILTSDETNALCDLTTAFNDTFLAILNARLKEVKNKKDVVE